MEMFWGRAAKADSGRSIEGVWCSASVIGGVAETHPHSRRWSKHHHQHSASSTRRSVQAPPRQTTPPPRDHDNLPNLITLHRKLEAQPPHPNHGRRSGLPHAGAARNVPAGTRSTGGVREAGREHEEGARGPLGDLKLEKEAMLTNGTPSLRRCSTT